MKFIELTVPQDDGTDANILINVNAIEAIVPNTEDASSGGGFMLRRGKFTRVKETYEQIKEKLNEI